MVPPLRVESLYKSFCKGDVSLPPHLLSQPIIYLDQDGLKEYLFYILDDNSVQLPLIGCSNCSSFGPWGLLQSVPVSSFNTPQTTAGSSDSFLTSSYSDVTRQFKFILHISRSSPRIAVFARNVGSLYGGMVLEIKIWNCVYLLLLKSLILGFLRQSKKIHV